MTMQPYQQVCSDHLVARLVAAILHKLGETSITISSEDLQNLPVGQIEATGDPFGGAVTYAFRQVRDTGQDDLLHEPVPAPPPIAEDPMPQTRVTLSPPAPHPPLHIEGSILSLDKIAARGLSDDQLRSEYESVCNRWDSLKDEDLARGGSPLESMSERIEEIETEAKRRGVALT